MPKEKLFIIKVRETYPEFTEREIFISMMKIKKMAFSDMFAINLKSESHLYLRLILIFCL